MSFQLHIHEVCSGNYVWMCIQALLTLRIVRAHDTQMNENNAICYVIITSILCAIHLLKQVPSQAEHQNAVCETRLQWLYAYFSQFSSRSSAHAIAKDDQRRNEQAYCWSFLLQKIFHSGSLLAVHSREILDAGNELFYAFKVAIISTNGKYTQVFCFQN